MRTDGKTNAQTVSKLNLDKLSVVKQPAQAPALAAIIKSIKEDNTDENIIKQTFMEALHEITLDEQISQLMDTMWDLSWALRKSIRGTVEDANVTNKKEVIQGNISDFATSMSNLVNEINIIKTGGSNMKPEEIQKMVNDGLAPLKEELDFAQTVIKMSPETRVHFDTLDSDGQKAFIKMSTEDQETAIKKAKGTTDADETIVMHGQTIKKSDVGSGVFHVLQAQQAEIEEGKKAIAKEKGTRELMEFTKQAEGMYPNLPGDPSAKGMVMKTIAGLDTEIRDTLTGMLKAGNEGIEVSKTFTEIGSSTVPAGEVSAVAKLNKMAEDKAAKDNVTFAKAYNDILETEEGAKLYEQSLKK